MIETIVRIALSILVHHGEVISHDFLKAYADVAHGKGGIGKVAKALGDIAKIAQDAASE